MNEYVLVQNMDISRKKIETIQIIRNIELDTLFAKNIFDIYILYSKEPMKKAFHRQRSKS